jgi:hypothetical protein
VELKAFPVRTCTFKLEPRAIPEREKCAPNAPEVVHKGGLGAQTDIFVYFCTMLCPAPFRKIMKVAGGTFKTEIGVLPGKNGSNRPEIAVKCA